MKIRSIEAHEREQVLDLLHEWISRDFFRRYFDHDPGYRDDLCLVAEENGRFVSTLQIWPRTVRLNGREVTVGGIGNVYTTDAYREQRLASELLLRAVALMEEQKFDLSLLFASRLTFYGRLGWGSLRRLLGAMTPAAEPTSGSPFIRPFEAERDLKPVIDIYESYSRGRSGVVARDLKYWRGLLRFAGNPEETFLVYERDGRVSAYARLVDFYGADMVMEHGAAPGEDQALVELLADAVERSRERGFCLFHLGAGPDLAPQLVARGLGVNEVEDVFWMWRVISPEQLASKLGVSAAAVEDPRFFESVLPYRGSVFWTSDRF